MMAFSTAVKVPRMPLVVILGSTGTGKTKLSLELAQRFNGEVISADSMQVYTDLDIITAKATKEERSLVEHHLLDVVDPLKAFTVVDFRNRAVGIIDDLLSRNKMPIVVGGTNYYIESLLWKVLVDEPGSMPGDSVLPECEPVSKKPRIEDDTPSEELHKKLMELDPDMAKRLHPNNRRKILRRQIRLEHAYLRDVSNPFEMPNAYFKKMYRLPKGLVVHVLLPELEPYLYNGQRSTYIPVHLRVLTTLHFLAQGTYQSGVGKDFHLAISQPVVSRVIDEITMVFTNHLFPRYVKFSINDDEINEVEQG